MDKRLPLQRLFSSANLISFIRRASQAAIRHRWVVIIGIGILSILVDLNEFLFKQEQGFNLQFVADLFIHGVLVPMLIWILLGRLDRSEQIRSMDEKQLALQQLLAEQLSHSNHWNDLVETVIEFPRAIFPYIGAYLWVYAPDSHQFLLEAGWGFTGINPPTPPDRPFVNSVSPSPADLRRGKSPLTAMDVVRLSSQEDNPELIVQCIPFVHQSLPVALLYCYLPANFKLTRTHQLLIDYIAPTIAAALYESKANDPALLQAKAVNEERSRIAKNLHDSLAQDLAYLLHELEYFSDTKYRDLVKLVTIQEELTKMREIANQAYTEIRDILENLELENKHNLVTTLSDYAHSFQLRSGLEVAFKTDGVAQTLPANVETQIITIFRELLANISFHAHAHQVDIELAWSAGQANLVVSDDGQGFDPERASAAGHYGLKIMQHRAEEINAHLSINSAPGSGTRVELTIPLQSMNGPVKSQSFRWLNSAVDQTHLNR